MSSVSTSIAKSISNVCDNIQIDVKNSSLCGRFFSKLKDQLTHKQIECENCGNVHIGTTSQKLKKRNRQLNCDVNNERINRSALALHPIEDNHQLDLKNVKILEDPRGKASKICVYMKSIESKNVNSVIFIVIYSKTVTNSLIPKFATFQFFISLISLIMG